MRESNKIIDVFMDRVGLFENVFWKASDKIVFDTEYERVKNILKEVHGKKDVDIIFHSIFDEEKAGRVMGTMFRFADQNNNGVPDQFEKNVIAK